MDPYSQIVLAALNVVDHFLQLQLLLPPDVRDKQSQEWQAFIDWTRKTVGLWVPPSVPPHP